MSGTVPTELGTIGHPFEVLAVNDNNLQTPQDHHSKKATAFPPQVCNLTGLQIVSIANNDFSGLLPNAGELATPFAMWAMGMESSEIEKYYPKQTFLNREGAVPGRLHGT